MKLFTATLTMMVFAVGAHAGHRNHDHHHHHQPMSPQLEAMMKEVESVCSLDVAMLCSNGPVVDPFADLLSVAGFPSHADSFPSLFDQIMTAAIEMPKEMPQVQSYYIIMEPSDVISDEQQSSEVKPPSDESEQLLDALVTSVKEKPHVDPIAVSKSIMEYGAAIMDKENLGDDHRRMARRLMEAHGPDSPAGRRRLPLPFGCPKNRCLREAYNQGAVSEPCASVLKKAEDVQRAEVSRHMLDMHHQQETFMSFTMLYFILAFCTLFVLHRRLHKHFKKVYMKRKLADSIVQAVYNDPELKKKVEDSVQRELGHVPPLPPHVLAKLGGRKMPMPPIACLVFKFMAIVAVAVLAFHSPMLAMPVLCAVMLVRCLAVSFGFCIPKLPKADCKCCCCALSTEDIRLGKELTKEQACCTCCNGTGVCPPTCRLCCGFDPKDACTCCSDGCDCCSPKKKSGDNNNKDCCDMDGCCDDDKKVTVYHGIPIQVV